MKRLYILLLCLLPTLGFAQNFEQDSAWIVDNYTKTERYIEMRDGIRLFTTIYAPKDATEKHPILMTRTPYSCRPYGENQFSSRLWTRHQRYYLREGYIMVFQDVRGRWMSEGQFVDVRPFNPNKRTDREHSSGIVLPVWDR